MQRKQRNPKRRVDRQVISHPPQIREYAIRHGTRLRFTMTAAASELITYQNLLDCILIGITTTTLTDIFQQVKIRAVEVWSISAVGTPATCSVQFPATAVGLVGDARLHTDTSMGVEPAHVRAVPAKGSQASLFQVSSANTAFIVTASAGSVVDVELTFVQSSEQGTQPAQNAGVAITVGASYWRGLDGLAKATSNMPSISTATA